MVIFHSYVKLPEGITIKTMGNSLGYHRPLRAKHVGLRFGGFDGSYRMLGGDWNHGLL